MNQFIQRVANYIANELFIKGLAESKTFQRFAVHTDRHIQKYKKEGLEQVNAHLDELHKHATSTISRAASSSPSSNPTISKGANGMGGNSISPPHKPLEGVPGFFNALARVIKRDLGMAEKGKQ